MTPGHFLGLDLVVTNFIGSVSTSDLAFGWPRVTSLTSWGFYRWFPARHGGTLKWMVDMEKASIEMDDHIVQWIAGKHCRKPLCFYYGEIPMVFLSRFPTQSSKIPFRSKMCRDFLGWMGSKCRFPRIGLPPVIIHFLHGFSMKESVDFWLPPWRAGNPWKPPKVGKMMNCRILKSHIFFMGIPWCLPWWQNHHNRHEKVPTAGKGTPEKMDEGLEFAGNIEIQLGDPGFSHWSPVARKYGIDHSSNMVVVLHGSDCPWFPNGDIYVVELKMSTPRKKNGGKLLWSHVEKNDLPWWSHCPFAQPCFLTFLTWLVVWNIFYFPIYWE